MRWSGGTRGGWAAAAALVAASAWAGAPDDDLAVVKKAVAVRQAPAPADAPAKVAPPAPRKGDQPQWLRVRVVEKGARKAKVSINLPLAVARALGDDVPFAWHCHGRDAQRCSLKVSELLASLEAGQDLVEIEDEDATVRVWVE